MNNDQITFYSLYFFLGSFLGWVIESTYRSADNKRWVNSGFLYGPLVPIYGLAALIILLIQKTTLPYPVQLLSFFLLPTVMEFAIHYFFIENLKIELWDYSRERFNIQGRICPKFSLMWVGLVIAHVSLIQPQMTRMILSLHHPWGKSLLLILTAILSADLFLTLWNHWENRISHITEDEENRQFISHVIEITTNERFCRTKEIHHHDGSIFEHSLIVAWVSYRISIYLAPFIPLDERSLVRGALLHDFFLYDWRIEKPGGSRFHPLEHPREALRNSRRDFDINPIERDIITKHMWPLCFGIPLYWETVVVLLVDKGVALWEYTSALKFKISQFTNKG